jgi:hypothetical protein
VTWARAADRGSLPPYGLWRLVLDDPAVRGGAIDRARQDLWSRVFGDAKRQALASGADSSSAQRFALFADVRGRLTEAAADQGPCSREGPGRPHPAAAGASPLTGR